MASIKTQKRNRSNKLGSTVSKNRRTKKVGGIKRKRSVYQPEKKTVLFAKKWALRSMRDVMGRKHVRKAILQQFVPDIKNLEYTETFDGYRDSEDPSLYKNKESQILAYCEKISTIQPYVVFTASNILFDDVDEHGKEDTQTHYQCFYVDNANKTLYVFDPARKVDGSQGIYEPQIAKYTVNKFFRKKKYTVFFARLSHPAQMFESDVFCQTWTLYLLIQFFKHDCKKDAVLPVPENLVDRYAIIIEFYHKILDTIPEVKNELIWTYQEDLKNKDHVDEILADGGTKHTIQDMLKQNPYRTIKSMNAKHLFTDEDRKKIDELAAEEEKEEEEEKEKEEDTRSPPKSVRSRSLPSVENQPPDHHKQMSETMSQDSEEEEDKRDEPVSTTSKKQKPWWWPW
jgi:hypothetical protein